METKKCIYCGSENNGDAQKCAICGSVFETTPSPVSLNNRTKYKSKQRPSVPAIIVSILLCILLFVTLIVSSLLTVVQKTVSNENITRVINETDFYDLAESALMNETVEEYCKSLLFDSSYETYITEKSLRKIFNSGALKNFVCEKISDYTSDIISENNLGYLSAKEVSKIFFKVYEKNEDMIGLYLDDTMKVEIENYINSLDYEMYSIPQMRNDDPALFMGMKIALTPLSVIGVLVLAGIFVLLIILLNKHFYKWWMNEVGVTFFAGGIIFLIARVASLIIIDNGNKLLRFLEPAVEYSFSIMTSRAIALTLIGILLMLGAAIISLITRKMAKAK